MGGDVDPWVHWNVVTGPGGRGAYLNLPAVGQ